MNINIGATAEQNAEVKNFREGKVQAFQQHKISFHQKRFVGFLDLIYQDGFTNWEESRLKEQQPAFML